MITSLAFSWEFYNRYSLIEQDCLGRLTFCFQLKNQNIQSKYEPALKKLIFRDHYLSCNNFLCLKYHVYSLGKMLHPLLIYHCTLTWSVKVCPSYVSILKEFLE